MKEAAMSYTNVRGPTSKAVIEQHNFRQVLLITNLLQEAQT